MDVDLSASMQPDTSIIATHLERDYFDYFGGQRVRGWWPSLRLARPAVDGGAAARFGRSAGDCHVEGKCHVVECHVGAVDMFI